ncbi:hypothetical protein RhiLY_01699 [Ceratobasidium sp. AG-Ba]|nr:hypothetical protein RhiLY_01699 [Ceratobasidium sp. AG-Ba]
MFVPTTGPSFSSVLSTLATKDSRKIPLELVDALKNASSAVAEHEHDIKGIRARPRLTRNDEEWAYSGYEQALAELITLARRGPPARALYPPWVALYTNLACVILQSRFVLC